MGKSLRITFMSSAGLSGFRASPPVDIMVAGSGMFGRYMTSDQLVDISFHRADLQLLGDVESKGVDQKGLGRRFADPARAEIKKRFFAELTHGTTMTAFYVVRVDLELGFAVDGRPFADDEIVVLLEGVGLLRILVHVDLTVEDARGLLEQHALVELIAETKGLLVIDQRMIVHQLVPGGEIKAVQMGLGVIFLQP